MGYAISIKYTQANTAKWSIGICDPMVTQQKAYDKTSAGEAVHPYRQCCP